jgi:hypothetical protein
MYGHGAGVPRTAFPAASSIAASPKAVPTATVYTGGLMYRIVS